MFPIGAAGTLLLHGAFEFYDTYAEMGEVENFINMINHLLKFYAKALPNKNEHIFYGQVADGTIDHAFYVRPEEMANQCRPSWKCDPTGWFS